jgi:hypothetical protein
VHKGNWFKGCYFSLVKVDHYYFPLGGLGWVGIGCLQLGDFVGGVPSLSLVPVLSFLLVIVGLVRWIGLYSTVQKFEPVEEGKVG